MATLLSIINSPEEYAYCDMCGSYNKHENVVCGKCGNANLIKEEGDVQDNAQYDANDYTQTEGINGKEVDVEIF